ncbi:MAG: hypothetical protein ACFCUR_19720 [Rhodomicrobiaceae bacterium]
MIERKTQRFGLDLFIVHPSYDPADINTQVGMEGHIVQRVGDPRITPKGTRLPGRYPETRWRHCLKYEKKDQYYETEVTGFVNRLEARKVFFFELFATGGRGSLIIKFLGDDGHFGDEIPITTLAKLVDLKLTLAVECCGVPQA